jgi:hypothetical protein
MNNTVVAYVDAVFIFLFIFLRTDYIKTNRSTGSVDAKSIPVCDPYIPTTAAATTAIITSVVQNRIVESDVKN